MTYEYHTDGQVPEKSQGTVFVFGSNLSGRHGRGAALVAAQVFGAKYGCGAGFSGQSFAIPTKDERLRVLPLDVIQGFVSIFLEKAYAYDQLQYFVTRVGCGLAGYKDEQIAPMFAGAPRNCNFSEEWRPFLDAHPKFDINL